VTLTAERMCPACGAGAAPDDRFCESCGRELSETGDHPDAPSKAPPQPAGPAGRARHPCAECGCAQISADGYCEQCGHRQPTGRDHEEVDTGYAAGVSDRGRLPRHNEDAMAAAVATAPDGTQITLVVVCDGVSTTPLAADASLAAAQVAVRVLASAVARAASAVTALERNVPPGVDGAPSCTYVSASVGPASVTVAWLGDSRAYWLATAPAAKAASRQLTSDDSWAAAQVASGALTADEAYADHRAHAITAWLGADADTVEPHVVTFAPDGPGLVLVCTDGLWNYLPNADQLAAAVFAASTVFEASTGPEAAAMPLAAARNLVRIALQAGGHDNITAVLIPTLSPESQHD
jgi:serine/threonine protein phosphatase PrpC